MGILNTLIGVLPPGLFTYVAGIQHRNPALRPLMRQASRALHNRSGRIPRGLAAGLRFDCGASVLAYLAGTAEPQTQQLLPLVVSAGDTVYDVGSNVGFFTLGLARLVGPGGRVVAFEPLSANATTLRHNISLNRLPNVDVLQVAVGDREGKEPLLLGAGSTVARLAGTGTFEPGAGHEAVSVASLDHLYAWGRVGPANLIKMDIEGGEVAALRGMRRLLTRVRPLLLCELHATHAEVASLLRQRAYSCFCVEDPELTLGEMQQMHWNAHVLAYPDERAGELERLRRRWAETIGQRGAVPWRVGPAALAPRHDRIGGPTV